MVTSVEAHATRAGIEILEASGNAVDAAVAVAYALAVTHPSAGNLGGGGFMLVREPQGPTVAVDFRETAPAHLTRARFDEMIAERGLGPVSVGVPGTVAGLVKVHERFGRLPRARVIEPALRLARDGHQIGSREALTIAWNWGKLSRDPAARVIFGQGGKPRPAGSRLLRTDLMHTLERISRQGAAGFYQGETAQAIVARLAEDGLLSAEDLESYRAIIREPLEVGYRGFEVQTMPPPSSGGVALVRSLIALEREHGFELDAGSPEEVHLLAEIFRRAQAERRFAVTDPARLTAAELDRRIKRWTDPTQPISSVPIDRHQATPSSAIHPLYAAALRELEHTTHFSVIDAEGMVVSCTTTLSSGFGSGIVVPETGIVLNNSVGSFGSVGDNQPEGGRRTVSSMAPTLVLANGTPVLVLGSPGGDTIPATVTQVLHNVIDHRMTIDDAVDAARIHHGFVPDELRYEGARPIAASTIGTLTGWGHTISTKRIPIGDANVILIAGSTAWGYADRREGGLALAAAAVDPVGKSGVP